jgi:hypothetical protein
MDRQQKIDRVANQGRVNHVADLHANTKTIHSNYKLELSQGIITETGELRLFKISPISGTGPSFVGRWDQKDEKVDVDIHGVTNDVATKFNDQKDGYAGHRSEKYFEGDKRLFGVKITIPNELIFDGWFSFTKHHVLPAGAGHYNVAGKPMTAALNEK